MDSNLQVGCLVKYKDGILKHSENLIGIVTNFSSSNRADRVKVFWNLLENSGDVEDWVQDLEIINEGR